MKKFSIFNRSLKDKYSEKEKESIINEESLFEQQETININEDLEFFRYKKKNYETAEDAISIRSVDYKSKMKWNTNGIKKIGLCNSYISKSFSMREQALKYPNLKNISEIGESPVKPSTFKNHFSKSMILCSPDFLSRKQKSSQNTNQIEIGDTRWKESTCDLSQATPENTDYQTSSINDYISTDSIIRRHNSNGSKHSSMKKSWVETDDGKKAQNMLSKDEIERQNIIHELLTGEIHSLNDLKGLIKNYKQPLETLKLMSRAESFNIFYKIENIIPIYEILINLLENEKDEFKVIKCVGKTLLKWSDMLEPVISYCTHLYYSKSLLEEKRKEKDFAEFLQCCSVSKFSRKLDLWTFLDSPRTRLVKYPLLIERIIKSTHASHPDSSYLLSSLKNFEKVLLKLDTKTGEEMCKFYLEKIEFSEQNQFIQLVKSQKVLLLEGNMKTGRSIHFQKIRAFLFNDVLVFTKPFGEQSIESTRYIVYGNPLPTRRLVLENIDDGEIKIGSFRSTFSSDNGSKNVFRLTLLSNFIPECEFEERNLYQEFNSTNLLTTDKITHLNKHENSSRDDRLLKNSQTILQVSSSEEKQLWLSSLRKIVTREIKREEPFQIK